MITTSFPYLKIARDFGVPYGDVIRYAEAYRQGNLDSGDYLKFRGYRVGEEIHFAHEAEQDRRRDVRHGRT